MSKSKSAARPHLLADKQPNREIKATERVRPPRRSCSMNGKWWGYGMAGRAGRFSLPPPFSTPVRRELSHVKSYKT